MFILIIRYSHYNYNKLDQSQLLESKYIFVFYMELLALSAKSAVTRILVTF